MQQSNRAVLWNLRIEPRFWIIVNQTWIIELFNLANKNSFIFEALCSDFEKKSMWTPEMMYSLFYFLVCSCLLVWHRFCS